MIESFHCIGKLDKDLRNFFLHIFFPKFWANFHLFIFTYCLDSMKLAWSNNNLSLHFKINWIDILWGTSFCEVMTTILIIFMFFLVYSEVKPTFLWLLSMVSNSVSQSHWHCLCWVLIKTLPWVLSFSLCSCGNKNLLVSYGEHYNRFWRWPLSKVTSIIRTNKCWNYVVSGGKHALPIQGHPKKLVTLSYGWLTIKCEST
jgi:hypothetical protein